MVFRLGGNEALDCVFVYSVNNDSGSYWHFVTAGLSDLYGDGRVLFPDYAIPDFAHPSGFGVELSLRVRKRAADTDKDIPSWPIQILHRIARYMFESGNRILPGDNIPWGESIDKRESLLNNFLTCEDHLLKPVCEFFIAFY